MTVVVRARIEEGVKNQAEAVLAAMGLTTSDAFRFLMVRIAQEGKLPFALNSPDSDIVHAMKEARRKPLNKDQILLNLICAGVNELVDRKLIDLGSLEDSEGRLDTPLFGRPARVLWRGIGHGELAITVWWNVKPGCSEEPTQKPLSKQISKAVDACCTSWLERKTGKWIQIHEDGGLAKVDVYLSRTAQNHLSGQPEVVPHGYKRDGKFFR
jgi:DNA-damage-inducible protein J